MKDLWKEFGRETAAGKELYSLFAATNKTKISYPPVKTKKRVEAPKEEKPCPQKAAIEYPELPRKTGQKIHAVDMIPKRRNKDEILDEIEYEQNKRFNAVPAVKAGQNRKVMVENL